MRTQDCREKLQWILDHCPIKGDVKRDIERAMEFCEIHPDMSGLSTRAIQPLIKEQDPEVQALAVSHVENALNRKTPTGGNYTKSMTEKEVRNVIEKAKEQVRTSVFNQTNDNIEWAKWSWNPVTGCKHGCEYCYARDIANRFYKEKFEPTFRPERLTAAKNTKVPPQAETSVGYRNVFVCSMADLFGDWVPAEWIEKVLQVVKDNPQWNFLFLTKNPKRYVEFGEYPLNAWLGVTVDRQARVRPAEDAFKALNDPEITTFLSCEPLLEPVHFCDISLWRWLIIGGCSGNNITPASQPEWEWVESLLHQARNPGNDLFPLDVYFKPNLTVRPREYPAGD